MRACIPLQHMPIRAHCDKASNVYVEARNFRIIVCCDRNLSVCVHLVAKVLPRVLTCPQICTIALASSDHSSVLYHCACAIVGLQILSVRRFLWKAKKVFPVRRMGQNLPTLRKNPTSSCIPRGLSAQCFWIYSRIEF